MRLAPKGIYHIYNQDNNRRQIFFSESDYLEFLIIFREKVLPYEDVLAYCLMPNHYHILLTLNKLGLEEIPLGNIVSTRIGNGFRLLQTQYARYLNMQQNFSGSVFRQKTKVIEMESSKIHYPYICFQYIHQNPLRAG